MSQLGIGAMIGYLGGNEDSVAAWEASVNKEIASVILDSDGNGGDGALRFTFTDGSAMELYDSARSCCESRSMHTDDDLAYHVGATLLNAEVRGGDDREGEYGDVEETAFLVVTTSKGAFTVNTYNSHNGYYGGISIRARAVS